MESVGTLAGGIAHDLNNLPMPILMGATLLKKFETSKPSLKAIENIERSVTRGRDLVKQVLLFARDSRRRGTSPWRRSSSGSERPGAVVPHDGAGVTEHALPRAVAPADADFEIPERFAAKNARDRPLSFRKGHTAQRGEVEDLEETGSRETPIDSSGKSCMRRPAGFQCRRVPVSSEMTGPSSRFSITSPSGTAG
ncbi:MAG TPA: hypothetical protein VGR02_10930 [Thermoanaerobaculia bacterium]|jgi:hypothetical protein|nr:hypothetical protein [Thermoanaerobaculia bacterium]